MATPRNEICTCWSGTTGTSHRRRCATAGMPALDQTCAGGGRGGEEEGRGGGRAQRDAIGGETATGQYAMANGAPLACPTNAGHCNRARDHNMHHEASQGGVTQMASLLGIYCCCQALHGPDEPKHELEVLRATHALASRLRSRPLMVVLTLALPVVYVKCVASHGRGMAARRPSARPGNWIPPTSRNRHDTDPLTTRASGNGSEHSYAITKGVRTDMPPVCDLHGSRHQVSLAYLGGDRQIEEVADGSARMDNVNACRVPAPQ